MPKSKYDKLIRSLQDEELYTASTIADLAVDFYRVRRNGKERASIRKAVYGRTKRYQFPIEGDDKLKAIGHAAVPAWYGRRWKQSLDEKALNTILKKEPISGKKWLWKTLILGFPLLVLAGISVVGPSRLREGYELLRTKGPTAAYLFFLDDKSEETLMGKGWSAFRNNRPDEAREIAGRIILSNNRFQSDALYLLAYIEFYNGSIDKAYNFFLEAITLYKKQNNVKAIYLAYLSLCRVAIEEHYLNGTDISLAETFLSNSKNFGVVDGTFYTLSGRVEFAKGNYENALRWAGLKLDSCGDNLSVCAQAYGDVGFYLILTGEVDDGFIATKKSDQLALRINDDDLQYYNLINYIVFSKCKNIDATFFIEELSERCHKSPDISLQRYLDFAVDFSCKKMNFNN